MSEIKQKIDQMEAKLSSLIREYNVMGKELVELRKELNQARVNPQQYVSEEKIKVPETAVPVSAPDDKPQETRQPEKEAIKPPESSQPGEKPVEEKKAVTEPIVKKEKKAKPYSFETQKEKTSLKKFIVENLNSKIGINITDIGVAIEVKYSC